MTIMDNNVPAASFMFQKYLVRSTSLTIESECIGNAFSVQMDLSAEIDYQQAETQLTMQTVVKSKDGSMTAEVVITGFFKAENCDNDSFRKFTSFNAPAILFPYVRSYISSLTAQAGVKTVIIPTVNLHDMGKNLLASLAEDNAVKEFK